MAKLPDGILGGFKGKTGNVIGVVRNGTQYIRSSPSRIKNPKTPKQQANRKKFALASKLAYRLGPFIEKGFAAANVKTPRGACISANMKSGIFEEGDSGIRYSNIMVLAGHFARLNLQARIVRKTGISALSGRTTADQEMLLAATES